MNVCVWPHIYVCHVNKESIERRFARTITLLLRGVRQYLCRFIFPTFDECQFILI